ncbi:hypothetical protein [Xinfangfangia pollutisoli]|uniref:hypothetical protein n=1 Tax=Xinfangfangia pollutisoli TaxID=2865960 RepID=UPI001CD1A84F|nr:hypothetical protein [Xinfangfangia pollutisoli]
MKHFAYSLTFLAFALPAAAQGVDCGLVSNAENPACLPQQTPPLTGTELLATVGPIVAGTLAVAIIANSSTSTTATAGTSN